MQVQLDKKTSFQNMKNDKEQHSKEQNSKEGQNSKEQDPKEKSSINNAAEHAKFGLDAVSNVGEAVGPYLPLISAVATLTAQIVKAYESAQYNKKSCAALI